ncbi:MAG: helix-turn-helix domain-containing protein [Butyrivibrio sp.]
MTIGERIKEIRTSKKISVDYLAKELGVSKTTVYRYEDSTIEKIPVKIFDRLCTLLDVTPAELMGNNTTVTDKTELPTEFKNARDAMEFILKTPTLAAYGGYDPDSMSDETIVEFANEILQQLKLVSYKYKTPDSRR